MKSTLLYISTLFFISVSGFGQKQVTDFRLDDEYSFGLGYVGQIDSMIYFDSNNSSSWKLNAHTLKIDSLKPGFQASTKGQLFIYDNSLYRWTQDDFKIRIQSYNIITDEIMEYDSFEAHGGGFLC